VKSESKTRNLSENLSEIKPDRRITRFSSAILRGAKYKKQGFGSYFLLKDWPEVEEQCDYSCALGAGFEGIYGIKAIHILKESEGNEQCLRKLEYLLSQYFPYLAIDYLLKQSQETLLQLIEQTLKIELGSLERHLTCFGVQPSQPSLRSFIIDLNDGLRLSREDIAKVLRALGF